MSEKYEHRVYVFKGTQWLESLQNYPWNPEEYETAFSKMGKQGEVLKDSIETFYEFGKYGYELVAVCPAGGSILFVFQREIGDG